MNTHATSKWAEKGALMGALFDTPFFPCDFCFSVKNFNGINASGEANFLTRRSTGYGEAIPYFSSMESTTYFYGEAVYGEAGEAMNNVNEIKHLLTEKQHGEAPTIYNSNLRSRPVGGAPSGSGSSLSRRLRPAEARP